MPATRFLQGLVVQHAEPWVIVSKEREVVFATDAFTRTFSHQAVGIRCDSLFGVCAGSAPRGGCCWDHLEDYRRASRTPLWLLHQGAQPDVSVLCELHPVAMDGEDLGVAIRLRPLRSRVARLAEHVLGSLLGALDDPVSVRRQVAQDLARGYDLEVHWVEVPARSACASQAGGGTEEEVQAALQALLASGGESPFDIVIRAGGTARILRVFPPPAGAEGLGLVVEERGDPLDELALQEIVGVVRVLNEHSPASPARMSKPTDCGVFSKRQAEVVALVAEGLSDQQIASRLRVSPHTIRNHLRACMARLGIHKRTQLVALYVSPQADGPGRHRRHN